MPANNSASFKNNMNIPTPPKIRPLAESNKQAEKAQVGLTEKQFQQNMAELKNILTQVDALMNNSNNSPETVARCQTLMGYAAAINLPQSRKNQLIGQFPPRVQQMYKQVAKSSEAKSAQRGVMQQAQETAMAQKHNDIFVQNFNQQFMAGNFSALQGQPPAVWNACLFNSSINTANALNIAIQNGWDINAKHKNPDGTESTYVEYQGAQIDRNIERSDHAHAVIESLIGRARSPEEEEKFKRAQQEQEAAHQDDMMRVQNLKNAAQTGQLNPEQQEELERTQERVYRKINTIRQWAQDFMNLAKHETDPVKRQEYQYQAYVYSNNANDLQSLVNARVTERTVDNLQKQATEQPNDGAQRVARDQTRDDSTGSSVKDRGQIDSDQLARLGDTHQQLPNTPKSGNNQSQASHDATVKNNTPATTVNLNDIVNSNKIVDANTNPSAIKKPTPYSSTREESLACMHEFDTKRDSLIDTQSRMAQHSQDLSKNETSPLTQAELVAQATAYERAARELSQISNNTTTENNQIRSNVIAQKQVRDTSIERSEINQNQTIARSHQTRENNASATTVNLNDITNSNKIVGTNTNPSARMSIDISASRLESLAALQGFHRNSNINNPSHIPQSTSGIQPVDMDTPITAPQSQNTQPRKTTSLAQNTPNNQTLDMDTPVTAPQAQNTQPRKTISLAQSTATSNNQPLDMDTPITAPQSQTQPRKTTSLAQNTPNNQTLDMDTPITAPQSQNTQPRKMPSLAQNTSNNQQLDMDTPITAPQSQNIQAPKIPSIAQNIAAIRPLNTNTPTQTQNTAKTSSGLSNTIRSIASIVPNSNTNSNTNNTENNVKPLDTSRVA